MDAAAAAAKAFLSSRLAVIFLRARCLRTKMSGAAVT